ncbi:hypothetical protein GGR34_002107 [Microvirga flocculans]|uniref:Protease n=1 Tax=Microvirga flocculans TaxID=217168 RepID=A0A7W6IGN4_9HYPH|nr:hypothetical protein [Microvirga flocculans]MBB4040454.1 hypothetical protein [Microvirga flocculans]
MIRLAIILIGFETMRRQWRSLAAFGAFWGILGLAILMDAADGVTAVVTEAFGYLLVAEGLGAILLTVSLGRYRGRFFLARGLIMLVMGLLIIDLPWHNDIANSLLFGIAFLLDGSVRLVAAFLVRYPRWKAIAGIATGEIVLAVLSFASWPVSYTKTVPFCIGIALLLSGFTFIRLAMNLRNLPPEPGQWPLFARSRWVPRLDTAMLQAQPKADLLSVRVWTPRGDDEHTRQRPVIDRYIVAVDRNGVISTGHAALECGDDIYVSHYPAVEIDRSANDLVRVIRANPENDVPGRFQPSYSYEASQWREADAHVKFSRFNAANLAAFWMAYQQDDTYNLANRNCSVVVALALESALEGVLRTDKVWRVFLRLLANPDLWLAAILHGRAESMTWTPGLVLDYARALRRIVHPSPVRWPSKFRNMLREHRRVRTEARAAA